MIMEHRQRFTCILQGNHHIPTKEIRILNTGLCSRLGERDSLMSMSEAWRQRGDHKDVLGLGRAVDDLCSQPQVHFRNQLQDDEVA